MPDRDYYNSFIFNSDNQRPARCRPARVHPRRRCPAGLQVTPTPPSWDTCLISGTPEEPSAEATYTITAANASGADDGHVAIVVYPSVPRACLTGCPPTLVDVALVRDVNAVFTNTGGLPETCTVSPALPERTDG